MGTAWVFPGQGSQKRGMEAGIRDLPGAAERFARASALLGRDLLAICSGEPSAAEEPLGDLDDTRNTQPALFVVESLLVDALRARGQRPDLVAGHSLGELVALYAAGVFDVDAALGLIVRRSELMARAGGGAMTAVMGFDRDTLERLVEAADGVVIANDNSDAQVVLSGRPEALGQVVSALSCRRAVPLPVSGAFHSPFMAEAAEAFAAEVRQVSFLDASVPVLSNCDPTPETNAAVLRERLLHQMTSGVRWRETMEALRQAGIDTAVEIGPGKVLSGLLKRSGDGISLRQIATTGDLEA